MTDNTLKELQESIDKLKTDNSLLKKILRQYCSFRDYAYLKSHLGIDLMEEEENDARAE